MKWALVDGFYEMPDFGAGVQNFLYEQAQASGAKTL